MILRIFFPLLDLIIEFIFLLKINKNDNEYKSD